MNLSNLISILLKPSVEIIVSMVTTMGKKKYKNIIAENLHNLKVIINTASGIYECDFKGQNIYEIANQMQETYRYNDDVNEVIRYRECLANIDAEISKHQLELQKLLIQNIESIKNLFDFTYMIGSPDEYWTFELAARIMECSFRNKQQFIKLIDDSLSLI